MLLDMKLSLLNMVLPWGRARVSDLRLVGDVRSSSNLHGAEALVMRGDGLEGYGDPYGSTSCCSPCREKEVACLSRVV